MSTPEYSGHANLVRVSCCTAREGMWQGYTQGLGSAFAVLIASANISSGSAVGATAAVERAVVYIIWAPSNMTGAVICGGGGALQHEKGSILPGVGGSLNAHTRADDDHH
jgi:hypothetical protein